MISTNLLTKPSLSSSCSIDLSSWNRGAASESYEIDIIALLRRMSIIPFSRRISSSPFLFVQALDCGCYHGRCLGYCLGYPCCCHDYLYCCPCWYLFRPDDYHDLRCRVLCFCLILGCHLWCCLFHDLDCYHAHDYLFRDLDPVYFLFHHPPSSAWWWPL